MRWGRNVEMGTSHRIGKSRAMEITPVQTGANSVQYWHLRRILWPTHHDKLINAYGASYSKIIQSPGSKSSNHQAQKKIIQSPGSQRLKKKEPLNPHAKTTKSSKQTTKTMRERDDSVGVEGETDALQYPMGYVLSSSQISLEHQTHSHGVTSSGRYVHGCAEGVL